MAYLEYAPTVIDEDATKVNKHSEKSSLKDPNASILYHYRKTTGSNKAANDIRKTWQPSLPLSDDESKTWRDLVQPTTDLNQLPQGSFCLNFKFTLAKPYLSRDDNDFYIIDNPIVREKVFRWPMVRPSAWKGSLRHALWQLGYQKDCQQIERIFGTIRDETTGGTGRLYLYPTFFDQIGLEIINPHDRQKRVGKNPILLECVPIKTQGTFSLLYAPVDLIGQDDQTIYQEVAADIRLLAKGLQALLTIYGFGAKTSSGFGLAKEEVQGELRLNYPDSSQVPSKRGFSRFGDLVAVVDELASIIEGGMA